MQTLSLSKSLIILFIFANLYSFPSLWEFIPLPILMGIYTASQISKNYGVITIPFVRASSYFLNGYSNFYRNHFSSNFWTAHSLNMVGPHFLAFWEIYILIIIWWPIGIPKHQMGLNVAEWWHMTHLSWNQCKTADVNK